MAQRKSAEDTRTQRQKFIDAAKEHGADAGTEGFRQFVRAVAKATVTKPKKAAHKPKR